MQDVHLTVISMTSYGAQPKRIKLEDMPERPIGDIAKKKNAQSRKTLPNKMKNITKK